MVRARNLKPSALLYGLLTGLIGWASLAFVAHQTREAPPLLALVTFALLSIAVKRLGFQVYENVTHSLVGVIDLATVFLYGPLGGGLVAMVSGGLCQVLCGRPKDRATGCELGLNTFFASGLNALMGIVAAYVYLELGGPVPLVSPTWESIFAVLGACVAWFLLDHLGWALHEWSSRGYPAALAFLRGIMPYSIAIELLPLPFAALVSSAYSLFAPPLLFLTVLAVVAVGLILRKLMVSLDEERRHVRQLSAISLLSQALLSAKLDLEQVAALVYRYCSELVSTSSFVLQLRDDTQENVLSTYLVVDGQEVATDQHEVGIAVFRWMESMRMPYLASDLARDTMPFAPLKTGHEVLSGLYVPILLEGQLLGIIALQSPMPHRYTLQDQQAVSLIAAQVSLGLRNASLYQQEQVRSAQLTMIAEVGRKVAAILDLRALFQDTVRLVQQQFGYYHVSMFTVDAERKKLSFRASSSPAIQQRGVVVPWGKGLTGLAAATGESVLVNDVLADERFLPDNALEATRAELAIPLKVEQRVLGVLDVQSNRRDAFGERDLFILQTLADQVAIAVEDSHLYEAQQEQAWVSTALLQVAEAVGQLSTAEEILETVVRLTPMLTGVEHCLVFLWSDEDQAYTAVQSAGFPREQAAALRNQCFAPSALPLLERARREGHTVHGKASDLLSFLPPPLAAHPAGGNVLAIPLRTKGQVIGILVAEIDGDDGQLAAHRETILTGIANQAAMALDNARLFVSQQEETWVSTALLQVANMVRNSTDLDDVLASVVHLTPGLGSVSWCAVLLWDEPRQAFFMARAHGLPQMVLETVQGQYYAPETVPLLRASLKSSEPITVSSLEAEGLIAPDVARDLGMAVLTAWPLRARERFLGLLLVGDSEERHLVRGRRANILAGIANQTALAIESARLYHQTVQQERLQRDIELARNIQASFLPEHCPEILGWQLAVEWRSAAGVGGDFYDLISLDDQHLGFLIADVSDKGVPAALYMAVSRTVVRTAAIETLSAAETLRRANRVLMEESRSGMFVSMFYGILEIDSGKLVYARAGHNPPLLFDPRDGSVAALAAPGIVLGVIENPQIEEASVNLAPGAALVAYTDGVTEAIDGGDREFGEQRLCDLLRDLHHQDAQSIVRSINAAVRAFTGERAQFDDLTLLVIKREIES